MNYTEKDFAGCLFNPLKKDLFKTYPRLTEITTGVPSDNKEKVAKYVMSMYDPQSPLIKEYRDIRMRKQTCASLAGFDLSKEEKYLTGVFSLADKNILAGVNTFLRNFIHSRLWYMICAREQTIYEYAERMLKPVDSKDGDKEKDLMSAIAIKSKLSEDMARMNELLEQDYLKYFGGDVDLAKAARKSFSPEDMATKV